MPNIEDLTEAPSEEVAESLKTIDEILNPTITLEDIARKIDCLSHDLAPLIALAQAIPDAAESNPLMKMLLGKFGK